MSRSDLSGVLGLEDGVFVQFPADLSLEKLKDFQFLDAEEQGYPDQAGTLEILSKSGVCEQSHIVFHVPKCSVWYSISFHDPDH